MNTTTPARSAGVAVRTEADDLTAKPKGVNADWACLTLLRPDDSPAYVAMTYAELGLTVIPDPHRPESAPLPGGEVRRHWQGHPAARVGLLTGHTFEVLVVKAGPEQVTSLRLLGASGALSSCFAQAVGPAGTMLLFAPCGHPSQRIGSPVQDVSVIGRLGRIDVTPADWQWLFVDVDRYEVPLDLGMVRQVLT